MSIKIRLVEDKTLVIDADREEWGRAVQNARANNGVIELHDAQGRVLAINPDQILYWEEDPEGSEEALTEGDRTPQPAAR